MLIVILFGVAMRDTIGPFMPCAGISIVPFISIEVCLLQASRPPAAATPRSMMVLASGRAAGATAVGAFAGGS